WYRELIALRKARPELTDQRLDRVAAEFGERGRWLVVRRGAIRIVLNLGPAGQRLPLGGTGRAVLAASCPGVALEADQVSVPAGGFAVIDT
ncbi:MAG: DUF3459 domain-containing protein, partial [Actinobacteria bacterium]|nr:DUF3459 domain-containing protein [Actinomycetota bacterium]